MTEPAGFRTESPQQITDGDAEVSLGSLLVPDQLSIWAWVFGYTALLTSLSVLRYHMWLATGYDLGLYKQGMWLLWHQGLGAVSTFTRGPILADGGSYILVLLAPLYALGGTGLIMALQALAFGLGYYWIRSIANVLHIDTRRAHLVGVIYLLFPVVLGANLFDFHPEALAVPLVFGMLWAVIQRRWTAYYVLLLLALCIGNAASLVGVAIGLVLLIRRDSAQGFVTIATACTVAAVTGAVFAPSLLQAVEAATGLASLQAAASLVVGHKLSNLPSLGAPRTWEYLGWLLGPLAGSILAARHKVLNAWLLPVLFVVAANLLSGSAGDTSPFTQASVFAVPFLFMAILCGLRAHPAHGGRIKCSVWLAVPLVLLMVFGVHQYNTTWRAIPPNAQALADAVALIPPNAPVVAPNKVTPHLANRPQVWTEGVAPQPAWPAGTYILINDAAAGANPATADVMARLVRSGNARTIYFHSGVNLEILLRPTSAGGVG